jgi:hypothetical protein
VWQNQPSNNLRKETNDRKTNNGFTQKTKNTRRRSIHKKEVSYMLEAPNLSSLDQKPRKKSTAKEDPRPMKNCAQTLNNCKVNLPH